MIYLCGQQNRRELVLASPAVNGIDYLEVLGPPGCGTELAITFLKDATGLALTADNIAITGGAPVTVSFVTPVSAQDPNLVIVTLDSTGDFSPYTLALVAAPASEGNGDGFTDPPACIDPVLSAVDFSFMAGCPSPTDCNCAADCIYAHCQPQPSLAVPPDVNYLARDYDSFRQVMLDRLAVFATTWTERHAADLGIVLAEVLAYAADHLSYAQDAVGTEAYLNTARSRISLRRHARLVDYRIVEGCNARALIVFTTGADKLTVPAGTPFYPNTPGLPAALTTSDPRFTQLSETGPAFSSLADVTLYTEQNEMAFYTWGDDDCCLPAGATQASLTHLTKPENLTTLQPGDTLVFEEVLGPATGATADADPAHRCAVRLVNVGQRTDPVTNTPVTLISWADTDALPFPLQVSGGITVARGNAVLADHGVKVTDEPLPTVQNAGRYYPQLGSSPLSFGVPVDLSGSLAAFLEPDPKLAVPLIHLTDGEGNPWEPAPDLLSSTAGDRYFVPEVEGDGTAFLRFGDGEHGALPEPKMTFSASYQVGNGTAGNVGSDALGHAVLPQGAAFPVWEITGVRNPLAVTGGVDPETMDHIREFAPFAFQTQERCVTEEDYGQQATLISGIQEARGTLLWTGSWYTAFVSVDPGTVDVSEPMQQLRMLGTDVVAEEAIIVGLRIEMAICVDSTHFRGDVYAALLAKFTGPDGVLAARGFTFGQTVYASPLIAAAQSVDGVSSVTLTTFSRLDQPWVDGVAVGFITLGRLEIPRCDNDPDHLDHGLFTLVTDGGK